MTEAAKVAGVQELIDRLRDDGVKAGRDKAGEIVRQAEEQAAAIIARANTEAAEMLEQARAQIETEKTSAIESLRVAVRDTELKMEAELKARFSAHVKRLVSVEMRDIEFLRQIILAVAGLAAGDKACEERPVEISLPQDLFQTHEEATTLTEEGKQNFRRLVLGICCDMLREGVDLKPSETLGGGIRVQLVGEDMEIDLSDKAISELLLQTMLPRYRAIVSGAE